MRSILGVVFCALALVSSAAAVMAALFLPDAFAQYQHEPEDAVLLAFWVVVSALLAALFCAGAIRSFRRRRLRIRSLDYIGSGLALVLSTIMIVLGWFGPEDIALVTAGLVIFSGAALYVFVLAKDKRAT